MAKGNLGSFVGRVTPNVNMVDVFKENEKRKNRRFTFSTGFSVLKIAISAEPGTAFTLNGAKILLPSTGIFELGYGMCDVESIVFSEAVEVNIVYLY